MGQDMAHHPFWAKVDRLDSGCWLWTGGTRMGYGAFEGQLAHRVAWELHAGQELGASQLKRTCTERRCVRPDHMVLMIPRPKPVRAPRPAPIRTSDDFWARFDRTGECWVWTGAKDDENGYGMVHFQGKQWRTHRLAWLFEHGVPPGDMYICHHCDNPPCGRPDHLFIGSPLENAQDGAKKRAARAERRGHIRSHGDGKWRLFVYAGTDPVTGRERRLTKVVVGSRRDAEVTLTRLLGEVDGGHHGGSGARTLGQLVDAFITHKTLRLEASSVETLRRSASYVTDRYRAMPAAKVTSEDLEALYAHLLVRGRKVVPKTGRSAGSTRLDPATVKNVHACLHGAFEYGRRHKWLAVNPAADAEPPAIPRRLPSPAAPAAIPRLLATAAGQHHGLPTYLQLTICSGARRSEMHGLRWSGVDFTRGTVVLRETVVHGAGGWQVKPYTKTGGQRTVHVDPHTLARLEVLRDRAVTDALACELVLSADAFVFTDSPVGDEPWNPNTTARRFKRACAAAGLPAATRLHDLRHLMATWLIDQGVPIPVVSARLGHAQNSTTLDIYTGRVAASDVAAAEMIGRLFGEAEPRATH